MELEVGGWEGPGMEIGPRATTVLQSVTRSHKDAPKESAPSELTSGFCQSHCCSNPGWPSSSPVKDGMQGQGVLEQASDKGWRAPSIGVGHLRLTLAHHVLTLGFFSFLLPF